VTVVITSNNNIVTGSTTWGEGTTLTLNTNGYVRSGAVLTLNVSDLAAITSNGHYIEVEEGGTLTYRDWTVVGEPNKRYRLKVPQ